MRCSPCTTSPSRPRTRPARPPSDSPPLHWYVHTPAYMYIHVCVGGACRMRAPPPPPPQLTVAVQDTNDNRAEFSQDPYQASVREDAAIGTTVIVISASDADSGSNGELLFSFQTPTSEQLIATLSSMPWLSCPSLPPELLTSSLSPLRRCLLSQQHDWCGARDRRTEL